MILEDSNIRFRVKPPSPPPGSVPEYSTSLKNTGSDFMKQYLNCFAYVWTVFGNSFWIYPVDIQGGVLFNYAWDGSGWRYIQFKSELIDRLY